MHAFFAWPPFSPDQVQLRLRHWLPLQGYTYHRMDGSTSVATRARLIDDFNNNPEGEGVFSRGWNCDQAPTLST